MPSTPTPSREAIKPLWLQLNELTRSTAKLRLKRCIETASREPEVFASHELAKDLTALGKHFEDVLDNPEDYPNPAYVGLAYALAGLLELYDLKPQAYARLLGGLAASDTDVFLDSWAGLTLLRRLTQGLQDDHDFGYLEKRQTLAVVEGHSQEKGIRGLTARKLAELVQKLRS